ncbi:helix-turn-helix domain-containing protein [Nocardia vermiculata]|uniref:XRE family transcriptional regulator n=1 Tax=Nocardia vermiculata TaxID=257274 RepID=A0A846Y5U8_9NOCA|nr:XRE family transcriptional regulator [Nocardia vermiculata]NKY54217.1 XRE family transcriptional regulator [Nocardia vermiculata]
MVQRFESVWDALGDTPEEAENMKARSSLMIAINERIDEFGWSQTVAANNIGVTQPRVSDLRRGRISKFSLDALIGIANKVGLSVRLQVEPVDPDDTLSKAACRQ